MAASPASAPESAMTQVMVAAMGTPAASAAAGLCPRTRSSKPRRVRSSPIWQAAAAARAMKKAQLAAVPAPREGRRAPATTGAVCTVSATKRPRRPRPTTSAEATKFSMMVVMTSCAPVLALSAPATAPRSAPAAAAASPAARTASGAGVAAGSEAPMTPQASDATAICPSPPMLKRPPRNATATASPVKTSGVARKTTCPSP